MAVDISGFGTQAWLRASNTFPIGFPITEFSDDQDAIDIPSLQIADGAMGVNGDLITWSKPNFLAVTVSVIPDGLSDINFALLLNANRVSKNKKGANDIITLALIFPQGNIITLITGRLTDGTPGNSVASAGRLKTKSYKIIFQDIVGI